MTSLILLSQWMGSQVEFWMPVQGFPVYDVSSFGHVRSHYKQAMNPKGGSATVITHATTPLKPTIDAWGYPAVTLYGFGKRRFRKVHRVVAEAFLSNANNLPEVNHLNAIRTDTRLGNLEWCTVQGNRDHAKNNGLMSRGEKRWAAQFSEEDVRVIRVMARNGASRTQIAKLFGCVKGRIRDVVLYRTWRHVE